METVIVKKEKKKRVLKYGTQEISLKIRCIENSMSSRFKNIVPGQSCLHLLDKNQQGSKWINELYRKKLKQQNSKSFCQDTNSRLVSILLWLFCSPFCSHDEAFDPLLKLLWNTSSNLKIFWTLQFQKAVFIMIAKNDAPWLVMELEKPTPYLNLSSFIFNLTILSPVHQ